METKTLFDLQDQSGSIVPIVKDKIGITGWNIYQNKSATREKLMDWVSSGSRGELEGYGLMMGYGNFHVIDVDTKNAPDETKKNLFQNLWIGIPDLLKEKITVQRTRNGGEHMIYKSPVKAHPNTLIKNPVTGDKVLEVIGSNNYILIEPSPGYTVVSGSLSHVHEITEKEHTWLVDHCYSVGSAIIPQIFPKVNGKKGLRSGKGHGNSRNQKFISASAANLESSGIDITSDYGDWIKIGYGITYEMGEDGREHFQKISSNYMGYDYDEVDRVYTRLLLGGDNDKPATGASLRHIMKKHGIELPKEGDNETANKTKTAISFIQEKGLLRNLFSNKVEKGNGQLISDSDVDDMYLELRSSGLSISKSDVASIINSSNVHSVNPVRDWFMAAKEFADPEAINELMACIKFKTTNADNIKFLERMLLKWLLQFPAVVLDEMLPRLVLVLIGGTYIGKSEFMRRILPEVLQKYYAESSLDRDKDSEILMSEHLLINVDEMAGIMKSQKHVERFKSLSSARYFTLRTPYGKINERFRRIAILCGTSNRADVIQDHDTGNSRIIPLEIESINWDRYNEIDRRALFGALVVKYQELDKESLRLTSDELDMLKKQSGDYTVLNMEQELIERFISPAKNDPENFKTVSEICDMLTNHTDQSFDPNKVSRELNKLGFEKDRRRVKSSNSALSGYYVDYTLNTVDDLKERLIKKGDE